MTDLNLCCGCRILDLQHPLIQQIRETQRELLAVVKERIFTTQPCTVTEEVQEGGTCSGMLGFNKTIKVGLSSLVKNNRTPSFQLTLTHHQVTTFQCGPVQSCMTSPLLLKQSILSCSLVSLQVSVNDKGKSFLEYDTNVSINIPPKTTIAYSVIELDVAHTGQYGTELKLKVLSFWSSSLDVLYQLYSRSEVSNYFCLRTQHSTQMVNCTKVKTFWRVKEAVI